MKKLLITAWNGPEFFKALKPFVDFQTESISFLGFRPNVSSCSLQALAPGLAADVRKRQALACPSTCAGCRRSPAVSINLLNTLYLQTAQLPQCSEKSNCSVLAAFSGQTLHFSSITSCFSSLLPSLLLIRVIIRPSLLHSLLHCYYYIITLYYGNNLNGSIITHNTSAITILFSSWHLLIHHCYLLLPCYYYLLLQ